MGRRSQLPRLSARTGDGLPARALLSLSASWRLVFARSPPGWYEPAVVAAVAAAGT